MGRRGCVEPVRRILAASSRCPRSSSQREACSRPRTGPESIRSLGGVVKSVVIVDVVAEPAGLRLVAGGYRGHARTSIFSPTMLAAASDVPHNDEPPRRAERRRW